MLKRICSSVFFFAVLLLAAEAVCTQDGHLTNDQDALATAQPLRDGMACEGEDGLALPPETPNLQTIALPIVLLASTGSEHRFHTSACLASHAPRAPPIHGSFIRT